MARTARKTTKKKTATRKKATVKKATTRKKKTTKKKLPEAPPVELFQNNVATPPPVSQRPVARRAMAPSTTKVLVKKPIYKNVELFKKYFDMGLGVLMLTIVGVLCLSAFFGVLFFFKEASTWHLQFPKVFIFFFLSYLVGYVVRTEN